jgi:hypothetical protein
MGRTNNKLSRARVPYFIGAVDWSFNEGKEGEQGTHWCQHVHGVALTNDARKLKKSLKNQFPLSPTTSKPVMVKPWDSDAAALRYLMKDDFHLRIARTTPRFEKKPRNFGGLGILTSSPLKPRDRARHRWRERSRRIVPAIGPGRMPRRTQSENP